MKVSSFSCLPETGLLMIHFQKELPLSTTPSLPLPALLNVRRIHTTELAQRLLWVVVPIATFGHMVCLQLHCSLDIPQGLITCLKVDVWKKSKTACARSVLYPLIPTYGRCSNKQLMLRLRSRIFSSQRNWHKFDKLPSYLRMTEVQPAIWKAGPSINSMFHFYFTFAPKRSTKACMMSSVP